MPRKVTKFRSKFEGFLYEQALALDPKLKYEPDGAKMGYIIEGRYLPDFVLSNGIIIEAKGLFDYDMRRKMLAVKKANPEADIRLVFMRAGNKLGKGSKTTYAQWAEASGFPWAEGEIPAEWIKEKRKV